MTRQVADIYDFGQACFRKYGGAVGSIAGMRPRTATRVARFKIQTPRWNLRGTLRPHCLRFAPF